MFNGSKFLLVIFGSIDPNQLSLLDAILIEAEGLWTFWVVIVLASEGSDCSSSEALVYVCLIFCVLNGIVVWLKCCLYAGCGIMVFVWMFTKQLPVRALGGSVSCFRGLFEKHEEEVKPEDED